MFVHNSQCIMDGKEYDFTVFGATGYTGKYVFRNLLLWQEIEKVPRRVAIAGRNKVKLESLVKETALQLDKNLDSIGLIIADVENEESLMSMCKKTRVILNACGPYILYGEQVVKACIQKKTHMVDISGEPQYLEGIQLKYHEAARKAGVYIIGSCGYDAIPAEIGTDYLKQKFAPGRLNQVEGFLKSKPGKHGITLNYGSLHSLVETFTYLNQLTEVRQRYQSQLFTKTPPSPKYPIKLKFLPWKNEELGGWCVPLPLSDRDIVSNSQRWFYEYHNEKPVQFEEYIVVPKIYHAIILTLGMLYFNFLIYFNCTRKLLLKYPKFFTIGYFSKEGPTRRQLEDISFTFQCVGKGWNTPCKGDEYDHPPNKTISCLIFGPDPGYETTSRCLIQAGLTVLEESKKMPFEGGCLTPAFAFRNTSLRQRLNRHAVSYEIIG